MALSQKRGIEFETVQLIFEIVNDLHKKPGQVPAGVVIFDSDKSGFIWLWGVFT